MKITFYFFSLILFTAPNMMHAFSYDSAIYAAQKGDWKDADAILTPIIIDHPDNADILHDAGVVAHKLGNFEQAIACFTRAANCAIDNKKLSFDARFKAGNACVEYKDLRQALEQYDKALMIKPGDEYARHNRDRVAQMLQEQEKEQQQKDDDKKENQEKDDKNNKEENKSDKDQQDKKGDQDKQQGNDQDNGDQDGQQGDNQSNQQSGEPKNGQDGDESDQQSQGDQRDSTKHGSKDAERKEHGNKTQSQQKSADNKQRNGDQELDKKSDSAQDNGKKQQGSKHDKAPEKQNETNDGTSLSSQGGQEQGKDDDNFGGIGIDDPWLLNVLNNQELQDKAINKKLMEAKISQHGGKNGQNCW